MTMTATQQRRLDSLHRQFRALTQRPDSEAYTWWFCEGCTDSFHALSAWQHHSNETDHRSYRTQTFYPEPAHHQRASDVGSTGAACFATQQWS